MKIDSRRLLSSLNSLLGGGRHGGRTGAIGLTFSSESLQLLQMEDKGSGPLIRSAVSLPYPCPRDELLADPAHLRDFIRRARRAGGFVGNKVITCLMPQDVRHIPFQYRQPEKSTASDTLLKELQSRVQEPLNSLVVDVMHIRTQSNDAAEKSVIAVVASRERTIGHLELLRMAGLDVLVLDSGPAALVRLISDTHYGNPTGNSNGLILNFGKNSTYLNALWGRRLMLNRELEFGENLLLRKICTRLKCDAETAAKLLYSAPGKSGAAEDIGYAIREILHQELLNLTREIGQSLTYVASLTRGDTAKIIYMMGGLSTYPRIKEVIEEQIQVPVVIYDPSQHFPHRPGIFPLANGNPHLLATATGLALRGLYADGN